MVQYLGMIQYNKAQLARVARKYKLKFVILHGSYAIGRSHKGSDLDIAIVGKKELAFDTYIRKLFPEFVAVFGNDNHRELDLKTLDKVSSLFRYEVIRDGVLLYGNPTDYEEYKAVSYRMYEDEKPLRELEGILARKYQKHLNIVAARYA